MHPLDERSSREKGNSKEQKIQIERRSRSWHYASESGPGHYRFPVSRQLQQTLGSFPAASAADHGSSFQAQDGHERGRALRLRPRRQGGGSVQEDADFPGKLGKSGWRGSRRGPGAGRCAKALAEFARTAGQRLAEARAALGESGFKHWVERTLALAPVEAMAFIRIAQEPTLTMVDVSPARAMALNVAMELVAQLCRHFQP